MNALEDEIRFRNSDKERIEGQNLLKHIESLKDEITTDETLRYD